jgi:O-antigen/teichoic acid export membrane protein
MALTASSPDAVQAQPAAVLRLQGPGSLGAGVRSGAKWMLGARVGAQFLQFVGVLVTARLLVPTDYGKMAVVYPIIGFAVIFTNLGLNSSIIHIDHLSERVLATAFWINALSGLALTVLVAGLSFPLAALFDEPLLVPLICLASIDFVIQVAVVHNALLERTLHFRDIAVIETLGAIGMFTTMAVTAALGFGPYALVLGPLVDSAITVTLRIGRVRWLPKHGIDRESAHELWSHAKGVTGFNVVVFWARNADNLLLAGVSSQAALGNYNRAYNLMRLPVDQTLAMMSRVLYPALARLRHDPKRLAEAWLRALSVAVVITAPAALLLAVSAPAAVHVLLGPRWNGMVPILELLSLSALPQIMIATAPGVLRATGNTTLLFRSGLALAGMSVVAMLIGLPWGTRGVATALLVKFSLDVPWVLFMCARKAGVSLPRVVRALRGVLLACAALLGAGYGLRSVLDGYAPWEVLVLQCAACGVAYVGALALLDRKALTNALSLAKRAGS